MLVPVAAEIGPEWADVPTRDAYVAVAWQGNLRRLVAGERVAPIRPTPSPLLARADIVAVSRHDLPHDLDIRELGGWLGPDGRLLFTAGTSGGLLLRFRDGRVASGRRYPAIPSRAEVDATGAGDTMLAGVVAARLAGGEGVMEGGQALRVGAAASSLLVEGPGIGSAPGLGALRGRLTGLDGRVSGGGASFCDSRQPR
jgi:hypothetical protein